MHLLCSIRESYLKHNKENIPPTLRFHRHLFPSLVSNRHVFPALRRFQDSDRDSQRTDAVFTGSKWFSVSTDGSVEVTDLVDIEIFVPPEIDLLAGFLPSEEKPSLRLLGHHIFGVKRSLGTLYLKSSVGMLNSKCVVKLRQRCILKINDSHDGIFKPALSKTLLLSHGRHFHCVIAKRKVQGIGIVDGNIENHTSSSFR